jgi:hypothetical protein
MYAFLRLHVAAMDTSPDGGSERKILFLENPMYDENHKLQKNCNDDELRCDNG